MLSDRSYMRDDYQRERTSFLIWLLSAIIAGFAIQSVLEAARLGNLPAALGLQTPTLFKGFVWTLVTYPLLHDNILHVLFVGLGLFFMGREVSVHVGERRLALLALAATVAGGLAWLAVNYNNPGAQLLGATAIVFTFFTVYACMFPNREVTFLVFFILPVRTRPKYVLWLLLALDTAGVIIHEIGGRQFLWNGASSAHLGAMLVGWLYYRYVHETAWHRFSEAPEIELPRWLKRGKPQPEASTAAAASASAKQPARNSREDLRAEVDRILDKINAHGFGALTPEEKRKLDDAKDMLSRR